MNNQIGSVVNFTDNAWGVYCGVQAESEEAELFGVSMLTAEYFARLYSTVRLDKNARTNLITVLNNPESIGEVLAGSLIDFGSFYGTDYVKLHYGLKNTQGAKKNCSFTLKYDTESHFAPYFRAKGFGFLGKNIESASVSACLATADFLMNTQDNNGNYKKIVIETIRVLGSKILPNDKLSTLNEGKFVRETALSVMANFKKNLDGVLDKLN